MAPRDPYLEALDRLEKAVDKISARVDQHEKRLSWLVSVAFLVVGFIGGPEALQAISGAA